MGKYSDFANALDQDMAASTLGIQVIQDFIRELDENTDEEKKQTLGAMEGAYKTFSARAQETAAIVNDFIIHPMGEQKTPSVVNAAERNKLQNIVLDVLRKVKTEISNDLQSAATGSAPDWDKKNEGGGQPVSTTNAAPIFENKYKN